MNLTYGLDLKRQTPHLHLEVFFSRIVGKQFNIIIRYCALEFHFDLINLIIT